MQRSRVEPELSRLASACGVESEFVDALGIRREASRDALVAVIAALGVDAKKPAAMRREARRLEAGSGRREVTARARCHLPRVRHVGLYANLYSVRASKSRGLSDFGDFAALDELIEIAARGGLDYVAINPLHALRNRKLDASPYYPVSRLFKNPLYIDPLAVAELPETDRVRFRREGSPPDAVRLRRKGATADRVRRRPGILDYETIAGRRFGALEAAHRVFVAGSDRRDEFKEFVRKGGVELRRFAIYQALDEHFGANCRFGFSNWPRRFHDPASPSVAAFAGERRERVDFHLWLQFETSRQWAAASANAKREGLRLGLLTDLAIGAAPDSADVWMCPDDHVAGFSLGAPPDGYSDQGQVWGLPPLNPLRLASGQGSFFRKLVGAAMDGAGALRIDHAIGLVRQYWIPNGAQGTEGVMVRMPRRLLFETIARESRRARCVVVGEDLGTIPKELPGLMRDYGMLSTRVLLFSRGERGEFESPRRYPRRAAASFATHDMVPFAGWIEGADLPILRKLGLIAGSKALRDRKRGRAFDISELRRMLRREGVRGATSSSPRAMLDAVHRALAKSPCDLVTLALDDFALEKMPINVPTATAEKYPVWSRRMGRTLGEIRTGR